MKQQRLLEICVDSPASALAAEAGGAGRLELCSALSEGGLTPGAGMLEVVMDMVHVPVHVLIRPRRGDFLYSEAEFKSMKIDIAHARKSGAAGVVLGMLMPDGQVDRARMEALIALARPMHVCFHRAFDLCADPFRTLDELMQLGIDKLLTSGQQANALLGADLIARLRMAAANSLVIMPGGGINQHNIQQLLEKTAVTEFHASARKRVASNMHYRREDLAMGAPGGLSEYESLEADLAHIQAMVRILSIAP